MTTDLDDSREAFREAIRGAFWSLASEDGGLHSHMMASYVNYYVDLDHDDLPVQDQVQVVGILHKCVLQILHALPSSIQMAHAHTWVHALHETYVSREEDSDSDEEHDTLLEEHSDDLEQWADEFAQFLKQKEDTDGEDGTLTEDA